MSNLTYFLSISVSHDSEKKILPPKKYQRSDFFQKMHSWEVEIPPLATKKNFACTKSKLVGMLQSHFWDRPQEGSWSQTGDWPQAALPFYITTYARTKTINLQCRGVKRTICPSGLVPPSYTKKERRKRAEWPGAGSWEFWHRCWQVS